MRHDITERLPGEFVNNPVDQRVILKGIEQVFTFQDKIAQARYAKQMNVQKSQ